MQFQCTNLRSMYITLSISLKRERGEGGERWREVQTDRWVERGGR